MGRRLATLVAVVGLVAVGCGDDDAAGSGTVEPTVTAAAADPTEAPTATEAGSDGASAPESAGLMLSSTGLGDVVVDARGYTVYLFTPDAQGESTCYDQCEANWPYLGEVTGVDESLDGALLGSTARSDGELQATYNGWPLYYFAGDAEPGDTNGQGVNSVWFVIDAAGNQLGG